MKRTVIAVILLILIVAASVTAILLLRHQTEIVSSHLDAMDAAFVKGDTQAAVRFANRLCHHYQQHSAWLPCLLHHTNLLQIDECIHRLPVLLAEQGDAATVRAEIARCRALMENLYRSELPLLSNIF